MTEKKMVDVPWVDGTTRVVERGSLISIVCGDLASSSEAFALRIAGEGGYCYDRADIRNPPYKWRSAINVVNAVYAKTDDPPVKVEVPTGIGAIVGMDTPLYVRTEDFGEDGESPWVGLWANDTRVTDDYIDGFLQSGDWTVIFEGVAL